MDDSTQGWSELGPFFPKSGNVFSIFKTGQGTPPPPPSCAPVLSMQEGGRRVLQIFQKNFVSQENIELNISWPCNFFEKYFMAPPINFSFLFKASLWQYFRVVLTEMFKSLTKLTVTIIFKKQYSNKLSKKASNILVVYKKTDE